MGRRKKITKNDIYGYGILIIVGAIVALGYGIIQFLSLVGETIQTFIDFLISLWKEPETRMPLIYVSAGCLVLLIIIITLIVKHCKKIKKEKEEFYKKLDEEDRIRREKARLEALRRVEEERRADERRKKEAEERERERLRKEYQHGYRDDMTGYEYEQYCADLFKYFNWNAKATKKSGDFGADVIATKDGIKIVVQCKKWKGSVGFEAVKEVFTAKTINKADYAIVITNSHFSQAAKQGAKDTGVILIRHPELEDCLKNLLIYEKKN
ncbi:MAG: restriction endonuclease [Treponema sp.]|nr:restriction endonuclease [Treponema sp.]